MAQLRLPRELRRRLHLAADEPPDHVSRMDVDGADGHDLLALLSRQLPQQEGDERVQLLHLMANETKYVVLLNCLSKINTL